MSLTHNYFEAKKTIGKIAIFQYFRAFACLMVCTAHLFLNNDFGKILAENYIYLGQIGVGIFFFISGYLIIKSLEKETVASFAKKRFFRIYPVYFVVSILILLFGNTLPVDVKDVWAQFFMLTDILDTTPLTATQWTLFIEIKFYFFAALAYYFAKNDVKKFFTIFFGSLLVFYLITVFPRSTHEMVAGRGVGGCLFISMGTLYYFAEKKYIKKRVWFNFSMILMIFASLFFCNFEELRMEKGVLSYCINYILGYSICLFFLERKSWFKKNKVVDFFANISYSLYLVHFSFGIENLDFAYKIICFAIAILSCWLIYFFVEKRFMV